MLAPRIILLAGKGGAGTTTLAAATARRIAADGTPTLLLGAWPATGDNGALRVEAVSADDELRRALGDALAEEDLALPGPGAVAALLALARHAERATAACIVVDCGAAEDAVRALATPELARRWLGRLRPARPSPATGALCALARELCALDGVLRDADRTSMRLVTTAEGAALVATRRAFTGLHLHGVPCDALLASRLVPDEPGPWLATVRGRQGAVVREARAAFAPVPVLLAPELGGGAAGPGALDRLGDALYAGRDAGALLHAGGTERLTVAADAASLRLALPFAEKDAVTVRKVGLELLVRVDDHRRTLDLPPALEDYRARGATLDGGALTVSFDGPSR